MLNKRLIAATALLSASLAAGIASAQDFDRGRGDHARPPRGELPDRAPRPEAGRLPARLINRLDTNGDDMVSLAEFTANATDNYARQFERLDRDDSGSLSADELQPRGGRHEGGPRANIDTDTLNACIVANGGVSRPTPPTAEERFAAADSNSDGSISQEEFFMQLEQRSYDQFARLDSDGNGQLTAEELQSDRQDNDAQRDIVRACIAEQRA
ncbi:MAG: EF-hand domain-containing protein [Pseudomonadales bacterium]|nr:EF-hand domain-containing protein [Pseudomonadales bacterium]